MLKYHNFQLPYFPVLYSPAIPHKLLVMGDPIAGKHAGGIFNTLPAVLIRAISNGPGGLRFGMYCGWINTAATLFATPSKPAVLLAPGKKERERQNRSLLNMKYEKLYKEILQ